MIDVVQFDGEAVEIEGWEHVGWRWRSATDRNIWHMTTSPGGRSYPNDAVFEPLYVPLDRRCRRPRPRSKG